MNKRLIFFDIDGTLINQDQQLPGTAKRAIKRRKEQGHEVAFATGRAPFMFKKLRDELVIHTYINLNGQYAVHNGEVIFKNPLSSKSLALLHENAFKLNHPLVFVDQDNMSMMFELHIYAEEILSPITMEHPLLFDRHYFKNREIYQALLFCYEEENQHYSSLFSDLNFVRWHPYVSDVLPAGGSKAKGLEVVINHLGFEKESVCAFGDGLNDIEMLEFVGNGVAMGNAIDKVKQAAKYVTKDINDNGILHGLKMLVLL
ncbi:Cof-type HAD-IIB family hydrolase [Neobacillus terrae]|uniref:Cof-type HAD-IIB family hydrolase n=1 Tax=Neobacillus terrae TaxID=3034837 RepID=UPI00140BDEE1|nr:Cof-type HAD-IIB family hydrolase [Neobacillus terrae]NHM32907.1 Cof-type HAD-IIB family hydrolase [Neobacillus terrae]